MFKLNFSVSAKSCENPDLLNKAVVGKKSHDQASGKHSWAIVCLVRSSKRQDYLKRNIALANTLKPFASAHDFNILMFSEDKFPDTEV